MMFGLGLFEIAAIVLVALVFIRPKDLPRLLRKLSGIYRQITDQVNTAKQIFNDTDSDLSDIAEPPGKDNSVDT